MQHTALSVPQGHIASVLIVDDHPLYRAALDSTVEDVFPKCQCQSVGTLGDAMAQIDQGFTPDLVVLDLKLPDVAGMSGFMRLRAQVPDRPIVVVSALAEQEVVEALVREGVSGFVSKNAPTEELRTLLTEVAAGRKYLPREYRPSPLGAAPAPKPEEVHPKLANLTPQQQRVLRLICDGKANKQIAYELDLAEATVKAHITALLRRLGVRNRTQAAVLVETALSARRAGDDDAQSFLAN